MEDYDYLIVGAGLAGLHCALRLARMHPKARIAIAEAYDYTGGRVVSYHNKKHHMDVEIGAGRIHKSHTMTLDYVDKYKLKTFPISPEQSWRSQLTKKEEQNIWPSLSFLVHQLLANLRPALLASHTVHELLEQTLGKPSAMRILNRFPYRAEMFVLRADLALQTLEREMGTNEDYWVVGQGLSAMIDGMVSELEQMDVEFFYNHKLYHVQDKRAWFKVDGKQVCCTAKKIILALHNAALKQINPFSNLPLLKKVIMCPLLRIYAKFPVTHGESWFSGMNHPRDSNSLELESRRKDAGVSPLHHTVTDSPLRYIIPINPKEGVIMISYTDAQDTQIWSDILEKKGEKGLEKAIMKATRELFPEKDIPNPTFFKAFPWTEGCSYWAPGVYNPRELSRKAHHPIPELLPNVYLCGESYSMKQCWMEGALEHAEELIQRYFSGS